MAKTVLVVDDDPTQRRLMQAAAEKQGFLPEGYADYRELNRRGDIEAVVVMTSWQTHAQIATDAMRCGKYAAMEVGGAAAAKLPDASAGVFSRTAKSWLCVQDERTGCTGDALATTVAALPACSIGAILAT